MASIAQNIFLDIDFASSADGITAAIFDSGETIDIRSNYPNQAEIRVKEAVFQNLFNYWTDSKDMRDANVDDIFYRVDYDAEGAGAHLSPDFVVGAIMTATTMNPDMLLTNYLPQDYLRYLSLKLFNTTKGVDIFSNEQSVLESINARCRHAFGARLTDLSGKNLDADSYEIGSPTAPARVGDALVSSNPSRLVMKQLLKNDPARFVDITVHAVAGETNWYKVPIMAGDSLFFPVTIKAPTDQHKLTQPSSTTTIEDRTVLIRCVVVADGDIPDPYTIVYNSALGTLADKYSS